MSFLFCLYFCNQLLLLNLSRFLVLLFLFRFRLNGCELKQLSKLFVWFESLGLATMRDHDHFRSGLNFNWIFHFWCVLIMEVHSVESSLVSFVHWILTIKQFNSQWLVVFWAVLMMESIVKHNFVVNPFGNPPGICNFLSN